MQRNARRVAAPVRMLVANKIKGYPDVRMISNLYSTKARTAKLHGMRDFHDIKFKILDSIRKTHAARSIARRWWISSRLESK